MRYRGRRTTCKLMLWASRSQKRLKIQGIGSLIGLLLIILVLSVMAHDFLTVSNLFNVLRQVSINALIAFGMTFVILTGGIDLSVGSILALSSAVTASMMAGGTDTWLAVIVGLVAGVLMGAVNGLLVEKEGLPRLSLRWLQ